MADSNDQQSDIFTREQVSITDQYLKDARVYVEVENASTRAADLNALGISEGASATDIKRAYRKKQQEALRKGDGQGQRALNVAYDRVYPTKVDLAVDEVARRLAVGDEAITHNVKQVVEYQQRYGAASNATSSAPGEVPKGDSRFDINAWQQWAKSPDAAVKQAAENLRQMRREDEAKRRTAEASFDWQAFSDIATGKKKPDSSTLHPDIAQMPEDFDNFFGGSGEKQSPSETGQQQPSAFDEWAKRDDNPAGSKYEQKSASSGESNSSVDPEQGVETNTQDEQSTHVSTGDVAEHTDIEAANKRRNDRIQRDIAEAAALENSNERYAALKQKDAERQAAKAELADRQQSLARQQAKAERARRAAEAAMATQKAKQEAFESSANKVEGALDRIGADLRAGVQQHYDDKTTNITVDDKPLEAPLTESELDTASLSEKIIQTAQQASLEQDFRTVAETLKDNPNAFNEKFGARAGVILELCTVGVAEPATTDSVSFIANNPHFSSIIGDISKNQFPAYQETFAEKQAQAQEVVREARQERTTAATTIATEFFRDVYNQHQHLSAVQQTATQDANTASKKFYAVKEATSAHGVFTRVFATKGAYTEATREAKQQKEFVETYAQQAATLKQKIQEAFGSNKEGARQALNAVTAAIAFDNGVNNSSSGASAEDTIKETLRSGPMRRLAGKNSAFAETRVAAEEMLANLRQHREQQKTNKHVTEKSSLSAFIQTPASNLLKDSAVRNLSLQVNQACKKTIGDVQVPALSTEALKQLPETERSVLHALKNGDIEHAYQCMNRPDVEAETAMTTAQLPERLDQYAKDNSNAKAQLAEAEEKQDQLTLNSAQFRIAYDKHHALENGKSTFTGDDDVLETLNQQMQEYVAASKTKAQQQEVANSAPYTVGQAISQYHANNSTMVH